MRRNELQMWTVSWLLLTGLVAAGTLAQLGVHAEMHGASRAFSYAGHSEGSATDEARVPVRVVRHAVVPPVTARQPSEVGHGTRARAGALVLLLLAADGGRAVLR
jgi:hypothetical protein